MYKKSNNSASSTSQIWDSINSPRLLHEVLEHSLELIPFLLERWPVYGSVPNDRSHS